VAADFLTRFVDREPELILFRQMLAGRRSERILCLFERSEQGKTYLILKMLCECEDHKPPVPVILLDFDQRRSRRGLPDFLSIAWEVRRHLGDDRTRAICTCEDEIARGQSPVNIHTGEGQSGVDWGRRGRFAGAGISDVAGRDLIQIGSVSAGPPTPAQAAILKEKMGRALVTDLATVGRAVLLVDTFEKACPAHPWLERWLFDRLPGELPQALVVVAGRPEPECRRFFQRPTPWSHLVAALDRLTDLGDDDILTHWRLRGLDVSPSETGLLQIARLSPAKMAFVGDLLEQVQQGGGR
jgi:hypothetical protein